MLVLVAAGTLWAAIVPVPEDNTGAAALAGALTGEADVKGASFVTSPGNVEFPAHGTADTHSEFPTDGTTFAILTNGDVNLADDPNEDTGSGVDLGGGNVRGDTDFDVSVLKVDVDVPAGANCLSFDFKFFSEEFPEYVGSSVNDAFIAELDESNWTTAESVISAPRNFAFDDEGNVISINASGASTMSEAEAAGTTYDGATGLLRASTQVTPGSHSLYLSIFDQGDGILDSAVFVDKLTVGFVPDVELQCASGAQSARFALTLSPLEASKSVGTDHTLEAKLTDEGVGKGLVPITFRVSGANEAAEDVVADEQGNASFTYHGTSSGKDTILACYDADNNDFCGNAGDPIASATATWAGSLLADVTVQKLGPADPVQVGDSFEYTILVGNVGESPAENVVLTDAVPDNLSVDTVPSGCTGGQTVECELGAIESGADPQTITIGVTAQTAGEVVNSATATTSSEQEKTDNDSDSVSTVIEPAAGEADLAVTKTDSADPVQVGETYSYTLTVGNAGDAAATGVSLSDVFPSQANVVSVGLPSQGACFPDGQSVTCDFGTIASGGSATVTIDAEATEAGTISNTAGATTTSPESALANNSDTETTVAEAPPPPGFTLDLTPSTGRSPRGGTHTVTAALADDGGSVPGKTIAFTVSGANSADGSDTTNADGRATFTYTGTNVGIDTITACYDADANGSCGDAGDASAAAEMTWTQADLIVTKSDSPDPVQVGATLTYTITVHNGGTADAANVRVLDTLPTGVTPVLATTTQGICAGTTTVDCALGTIPEDETATVSVQVTPLAPGELVNTATASTDSEETTLVNNSDSEGTVVQPVGVPSGPELSVTKTAEPASVKVGDNVTYTIVVRNVGDETASNIAVRDDLPESLSLVSWTSSSPGVECTTVEVLRCTAGELAPEASLTITLVADTTATGSPENSVTAESDGTDPVTAKATVTVSADTPPVEEPPVGDAVADLGLAKSAPGFVVNGSGFSYSLGVSNAGPDAAPGVVLTDKLPSGVAFSSASSSQGSCSGGATVTCALGTLKAKSSATVTINVTATSSGFTTNEAVVAGGAADPNPGNNKASATTRISPRVDLGIRGTVSPEAVQAGGDLTYHIVVTNGGPDVAEGVLVPLTLPPGATFVSVTPSQGVCIRDGTILCFLGRVAAGGSASVDLVLRSSSSGQLVLPLSVSSDGGTDSNGANNATSLTGGVAESFDLRIQMTSTPERIGTGEWVTYGITVTNLGPGTATGVKVVDTLPDSVAFVSCQTTQGDCSSASLLRLTARTVEARLGRLGAGEAGTVKIVGRATSPGTATNSATASGSGEDPAVTSNNGSTSQTPVRPNQIQPPPDVPPPVFNESVDAAPKTGTIRFRRPGSTVFEILTAGAQFPLGTEFDTTNGTMILTSATDATGTVQTAEFWDGFFKVTQFVTPKQTAITDLALTRGNFGLCKGARRFQSLEQKPRPKRKKNATTRQLWGKGAGKFRTKGRYSSAAVRGTYWLTADRCDGTLTSVREGSVTVRDFVRRRNVLVRAGQSYLARPKR